jgi:hypothetical protein
LTIGEIPDSKRAATALHGNQLRHVLCEFLSRLLDSFALVGRFDS